MRTEIIEEFLVFARYMNFSKAAVELHITQPNLSKHMMELERELGVGLIDRTTHGKNKPTLTIAGQFFFEEMSNLHNDFENTIQRCRELGAVKPREVTIQELWPNRAMAGLYQHASEYHRLNPGTIAHYSRMTDEDPLEALLQGKFSLVFDVQFGACEGRLEELASQGIHAIRYQCDRPIIWFQSDNKRLAGASEVGLEDLLDVPVLFVQGKNYDYIVNAYVQYCEREGIRPRLRQIQLMGNSPTSTFMTGFRDGALLTTSDMKHDPRLSMRSDICYAAITDERLALTFFLAVRAADEMSVSFLDFINSRMAE